MTNTVARSRLMTLRKNFEISFMEVTVDCGNNSYNGFIGRKARIERLQENILISIFHHI